MSVQVKFVTPNLKACQHLYLCSYCLPNIISLFLRQCGYQLSPYKSGLACFQWCITGSNTARS